MTTCKGYFNTYTAFDTTDEVYLSIKKIDNFSEKCRMRVFIHKVRVLINCDVRVIYYYFLDRFRVINVHHNDSKKSIQSKVLRIFK